MISQIFNHGTVTAFTQLLTKTKEMNFTQVAKLGASCSAFYASYRGINECFTYLRDVNKNRTDKEKMENETEIQKQKYFNKVEYKEKILQINKQSNENHLNYIKHKNDIEYNHKLKMNEFQK
jgi:hypothetical protein